MTEVLIIVGVVAGWLILQALVFPKLGIPT